MYEQYVQILRDCDFGEVREQDFIQGVHTEMPSYRMATIKYDCPSKYAGQWAAIFAVLAVNVKGYLTMNYYDHADEVRFGINVSTPINEVQPCATA